MLKSKSYLRIIVIILFGTLVYSCTNNSEDDFLDPMSCDVNEVSFSAEIMPIITTSCSTPGCHVQGGGGTGLFENYEQVKVKVDDGSFALRVITQLDMPPATPLTDCQLKHIEAWIAAGAPNN